MNYYHHGIFLGHEIGIADFGADDAPKTEAKPRQIDLFEFTDNGKRCLLRFIYPKGTCQEAEAAAHLAEEVVRDPNLWGPYNLIKNNCEHFATRCKTGNAYSLQIEEIKRNPAKLVKDSLAASFKLCASLGKKKEDVIIN